MGNKHTFRFIAALGIAGLCIVIGIGGCSPKPAAVLKSSGARNALSVGDTFQVVLKGNPTTGFAWHYTIEKNDLVKLVSEDAVPDSNLIGAGSTFTWNFQALKAGQTKITYKYYRDWEGEAAATTDNIVEYLVSIKK